MSTTKRFVLSGLCCALIASFQPAHAGTWESVKGAVGVGVGSAKAVVGSFLVLGGATFSLAGGLFSVGGFVCSFGAEDENFTQCMQMLGMGAGGLIVGPALFASGIYLCKSGTKEFKQNFLRALSGKSPKKECEVSQFLLLAS